VIASALPVRVPSLTASQLRGRILASADESYAGYAESNATFGLPPLAGLTSLTSLLDGVTKMRVWQATPARWRVDVLSDAGERDTYQLGGYRSYVWESGGELLTEVRGQQTFRLPRPADLVPPALAQRLLSEAGTGSACWSATRTRPRSTRGWSGPGCGSARSARISAPSRRSCSR